MDTAIHTDQECSICCKKFDDDHPITALRCGHVFGQECAQQWVSQRHNCPTCKSPSKKSQLIRLFNMPENMRKTICRKDELRQKLRIRKRKIAELKEENHRLRELIMETGELNREIQNLVRENQKLRREARRSNSMLERLAKLAEETNEIFEEEYENDFK